MLLARSATGADRSRRGSFPAGSAPMSCVRVVSVVGREVAAGGAAIGVTDVGADGVELGTNRVRGHDVAASQHGGGDGPTGPRRPADVLDQIVEAEAGQACRLAAASIAE